LVYPPPHIAAVINWPHISQSRPDDVLPALARHNGQRHCVFQPVGSGLAVHGHEGVEIQPCALDPDLYGASVRVCSRRDSMDV
jgi:hypothetical protein